MHKTLTIKLTIQPRTDRKKLAEAIAALINAVTPSEALAEAIGEVSEQIDEQLQLMMGGEEGDRPLTQEELIQAWDEEPGIFNRLMMGETPEGWKP